MFRKNLIYDCTDSAITYDIVTGALNGLFEANSATGSLRLTKPLNYEAKQTVSNI